MCSYPIRFRQWSSTLYDPFRVLECSFLLSPCVLFQQPSCFIVSRFPFVRVKILLNYIMTI